MEELDSVEVAKAVIAEAQRAGIKINMTQLQKLLFIIYGTSLAILNRKPFNENAQAWPYGPVFPRTRRDLLETVSKWPHIEYPQNIPADLQDIISGVIYHFGKWSTFQLITWSHTPGSPWEITTKMPNFNWGTEIGNGLIKDYFLKIAFRSENDGN